MFTGRTGRTCGMVLALSALVALAPAFAHAQANEVPLRTSVPDEETRPLPPSSEAALQQAAAAYEYGDMPLVVESARVVTDGTLQASDEQRKQALRYLGIGLYVTGRLQGAQTAFEQLLQLAPETQLDPATTRPEIVTFFYQLRRSRIEELRRAHHANRPNILLSFLPPLGQFANQDATKGWWLLAGEVVSLAAATTTYAMYKSRERDDRSVCRPGLPDDECDSRTRSAENLRALHLGSSAAFAVIYAYGVIDALINRSREPSQEELLRQGPPRLQVAVLPNSAALSLRF